MTQDKYFTPSIEDIRVGYECEINYGILPGFREGWNKEILTQENMAYYLKFGSAKSMFRVPYLTKEQIEAEGWKIEKQSLGNLLRGVKKSLIKEGRMGKNWDYNIPTEFQITYDTENHIIKIMYTNPLDDLTWFEGECKDINTFRYICKLLNIG